MWNEGPEFVTTQPAGWNLQCSYAKLPMSFYSWVDPTAVRQPSVVIASPSVAELLGLNPNCLTNEEHAEILSGNRLPPNSKPLAQAYAGHQFGGFTMLGDGRAILLGEQLTPSGHLFDVQLKGSGPTPYSRRGDGRASLGPMLREFIISHAMSALGIPTTRSLAVTQTGQPVYRQGPEPGAVLTRIAASHIRVGTFQFAAARGALDDLRALADYSIQRHYPELQKSGSRYLDFLIRVVQRQAALIAQWMSVGFIHGVMNTDNVSIAGETIDYGPCAFLNNYRASTVFSSIDDQGRYAYGNQPAIGQWNLARFAETLLPLLHENIEQSIPLATQAINEFPSIYRQNWLSTMARKLGLEHPLESDHSMISDLLILMEEHQLDFTNTFRELTDLQSSRPESASKLSGDAFQLWIKRWQSRLEQAGALETAGRLMQQSNPVIIPRNHQVEAALESAIYHHDLTPLNRLLEVLQRPFEALEINRPYRLPPPGGDGDYCTFCGT